jgi:hypothetical protein
MEVSGQLHAPAALPPGKQPRYTLDRKLGGPQGRSGSGGEEKNSQPLPGLETPDHPARSLELYRWAMQIPMSFVVGKNLYYLENNFTELHLQNRDL